MHNPSHPDSTVEITSVRFRPTMKALTPIFLYLGVFILVFAAIALLTYEPYSEMISKTPSGTFTVAKMNPPPDPAILLNAPIFVAVGMVAAAVAIAMYNLVAGRFRGIMVRTRGSPGVEERGIAIRDLDVCAAGGIGGVIFFGLGACTCLLYWGLGWLSSIWWPHSGAIYGFYTNEMTIITVLWIISQVAVGFVVFGGAALLYNLFLPWTRGAVVTVRGTAGGDGEEFTDRMYAIRAFATPTVARAAAAIGFGFGCLLVATMLLGAITGFPFLPGLPETETFAFDLLVCPFIYAGGAFLIGAIASIIYNAAARVLRGFVFRAEREENTTS
ncbi:hypothetical protein E2N92_00380 [Methanofollis formosanus]|uniref:Uncharacterized protein n=1 Tax=Methanofollis formosanus TaxID=299308 RepID=A0A8G0ZY61_9EURY|nr:hypothetical protein [Methanofollis formosanus]QYZ77990.1 hypothetical protein E2N92_00380 [Methanofollis formosanus]